MPEDSNFSTTSAHACSTMQLHCPSYYPARACASRCYVIGVGVVSRNRPFPFYSASMRERVWPTAIELPVLAFTQGRVSVNWFEVSRQPRSKRPGCQADNESH